VLRGLFFDIKKKVAWSPATLSKIFVSGNSRKKENWFYKAL